MKKSMIIALAYFFIAAIIGFILRYSNLWDMPEWFVYPFLRHTHSHIALLGWLFASFYLIIIHESEIARGKYYFLYGLMQISVLGMLFSFPAHGYYLISIIFTSLHIILCYVFTVFLFKDFKEQEIWRNRWAKRFVKTSMLFLVISTFGTWGLGMISGMGMKGTPVYNGAIEFYLHFFFNGFFIFAFLGIMINRLDKNIILHFHKQIKWIHIGLIITTISTFFHSINWNNANQIFYILNGFGAIVQFVLLFFLFNIFRVQQRNSNHTSSTFLKYLIYASLTCLFLKSFMQFLLIFPSISIVSLQVRNFIIGFIHLLMLGTLSSFVLAWLEDVYPRSISKVGSIVFFLGFMTSEIALFVQGYLLWSGIEITDLYYQSISLFSLFMVIGILIILCKFSFYNSPRKLKNV